MDLHQHKPQQEATLFFSGETAIAYTSKSWLDFVAGSTPPKTNNPTTFDLNDTVLP